MPGDAPGRFAAFAALARQPGDGTCVASETRPRNGLRSRDISGFGPIPTSRKPTVSSDLYNLVYISNPTQRLNNEGLKTLLEECRRFNAAHGLTGVLLYDGTLFMQCLEGSQAAVTALMSRIAGDPRHKNVATIEEGPIQRRSFADWYMGCSRVGRDRMLRLETATWQRHRAGLPGGQPGAGLTLMSQCWDEFQRSAAAL